MASNRPGEMQLSDLAEPDVVVVFQWPQIGRVRCNRAGPGRSGRGRGKFQWPQIGRVRCNVAQRRSHREAQGFNGLKSAG